MTLMGTMRNGVIVPDDTSGIPEGTRVQIRNDPADIKGFTIDDLKAIGHPVLTEGYPGEFDQINRMLQEERDAEVRMMQKIEQEKGE